MSEKFISANHVNICLFFSAAWAAIRTVFPDASVTGCHFHWSQAVLRKIVEVGLKKTYEGNGPVYDYLRQLTALPFLPEETIRATFEEMKGRANTEQLQSVMAYVQRQWIDSNTFPVKDWCVYGLSVRTNNDCEGKITFPVLSIHISFCTYSHLMHLVHFKMFEKMNVNAMVRQCILTYTCILFI